MSFDVTTNVLIYSFLFAFLFGAISQKTNFYTMDTVADWVNMVNAARLGAWFLAISVAIIGVVILENIFLYLLLQQYHRIELKFFPGLDIF